MYLPTKTRVRIAITVIAFTTLFSAVAKAELWQCYPWPYTTGEPAFNIAGSREAGFGSMRVSESNASPVTHASFRQSGMNGVWTFKNGDRLMIQPDGKAFYFEQGLTESGVDYRCTRM